MGEGKQDHTGRDHGKRLHLEIETFEESAVTEMRHLQVTFGDRDRDCRVILVHLKEDCTSRDSCRLRLEMEIGVVGLD